MSNDVTITVRVNDQTARGFRDVNGRLRDLQGRFAAAAGDMQRSSAGMTSSLAGTSSSLGAFQGKAIAAAAALGTSLLPAIGAAAPMLMGFGAAGGAAALAMDGMKEQAKELKKPFEEWQKVAEKAVLPHTEKAVKSLKGAMKDLNPVIKTGGEAFGEVAEKAARFADSPAFKGALLKNVEMGSGFFKDFAASIGTFTQAFLDFGTKSQSSLDAFQSLAGGLLDTGLPGMFKGLERGVQGSSEVLGGLAYMLNEKLLPAFGEFSGEFARSLGPVFGQGFKLLGDLAAQVFDGLSLGLKVASPLLREFAEGLRAVQTFGATIAPTIKETLSGIASAVLPGDLGAGPLQRLADAIERNKGAIQEGARIFGNTLFGMADTALLVIPEIIKGFRIMSTGVLTAIDVIVSGAAEAFGWIPGIGEMFRDANEDFDSFKGEFLDGLAAAERGARDFAGNVRPELSKNQLKMNISNWESQIATAKEQLKKVPPEKRAALKALIDQLQANIRKARGELDAIDGKTANTYVFNKHTTRYITEYQTRYLTGRSQHDITGATGGLFTGKAFRYAEGGPVRGPGTGTSDDVFAPWLSNGEFVIKAASVQKYGEKFLQLLNDGRIEMPRFAKGGKVSQATKDARNQLGKSFGISHFGRIAGYQRDPFEKALGNPQDLGALVSSLNQLHHQIKAAFSGKQESNLLKSLDKWGKSLIRWEKELASVTKSLDKAKSKLSELKSAASQLAASVKGGVLSSANITRGAQGDAPVTVASIMGGLTASRDKATAFAGALKQLQAKGLSSSLLQQIAEAGIEGGGLETAGALLSASKSEIASMNALQLQITKAAGAAGKTTADAVYGGAIKWQEKLISRLGQQQERLTKSMDKLAKAMERVLQQALKGKAAGGIVGMAAAGGIRSNLTWVGEQGPELLDLPAGSRVWSNPDSRRMAQAPWASMLNAPRRGPSPGYVGAPRGQQEVKVVLEIRAGDSREFTAFMVEELRKAVRSRGSIEATFQPPRGR